VLLLDSVQVEEESGISMLRFEADKWERTRNGNQKSVDWQFAAQDARVKLKRLYPQIKMI
jgi:hypothetical protein